MTLSTSVPGVSRLTLCRPPRSALHPARTPARVARARLSRWRSRTRLRTRLAADRRGDLFEKRRRLAGWVTPIRSASASMMALPVPAGASPGPVPPPRSPWVPRRPAGGERWLRSGGRAFFGSRRCGANCITQRGKAEKEVPPRLLRRGGSGWSTTVLGVSDRMDRVGLLPEGQHDSSGDQIGTVNSQCRRISVCSSTRRAFRTGLPTPTIMRSASGGAIMPYSFRRTLPDASQAAFSRLPEAHTLVMSDRPIVPPPASDRSSPNAPPGPVFSIAELATAGPASQARLGEGILYRLGDWAITDPFPDDAFLTGAQTGTSFHKKVIYDRIRWHRDLVEKIRRIADHKKRGRLQKYADIHMRAAEVAVLTRDVVLKACRAMNVAPPPILGLVTDHLRRARGAA